MKGILLILIVALWIVLLFTSPYPDPRIACAYPALPCDELMLR